MAQNSTFHLFARPSFTEGFIRILDLGTTLDVYNESQTEAEADFVAIKKDWEAVGSDIRASINKYEKTKKTKITKKEA